MKNQVITNKLIVKVGLAFFFLIVLMAASFILTTFYFTQKHFQEVSQKLNISLANHLIEEKFQNESPFLEDGSVNKALFGDLMHDMMAVNRSIEVYLLSEEGEVLYSVVLDHSNDNAPLEKVSLQPIKQFIEQEGQQYILGDDPRNRGAKNIFSAAHFESGGKEGYIYIILAGQQLLSVTNSLWGSYFLRLSTGSFLLISLFVLLIGFVSLWFLTRNLRVILYSVKRFQEGDLSIRIENAEQSDLSILATNFNEMADTIEQNVQEIQSMDKLRRELIANISHDLRTPLAILKGYVETLQMKDGDLAEEEKERYLQIINQSSDKLSRLISQLFEYSKLEAQQVKLEKEPFSICDLAADLVANYKLLAKQKGIKIAFDAGIKVPLVFADISLVERAIQNLMDNALKFTPENGTVSLKIKSNDKMVSIVVSDTGRGIKREDQEKLFERYRQAKKGDKLEGAGLGLAIVKKIMELHDTSIELVSKPNEGSSFQFALPTYGN